MSEPRTPLGRLLRHLEDEHAGMCDRLHAFMDAGWSDDELDVPGMVAFRVDRARATYGPLNLAEDEREFAVEAAREQSDRLAYREMVFLAYSEFSPDGVPNGPGDNWGDAPAPRKVRPTALRVLPRPTLGGDSA